MGGLIPGDRISGKAVCFPAFCFLKITMDFIIFCMRKFLKVFVTILTVSQSNKCKAKKRTPEDSGKEVIVWMISKSKN